MTKFEIEYTDPDTEERKIVIASFNDSPGISAYEWAEDYAYSLSDKNTSYKIRELAQ